MKNNKFGFTLVELITCMAIIAVLAAILFPTMMGFIRSAQFSQANANAKTVYNVVSAAVIDYATTESPLTPGQYQVSQANLSNASIGGHTFNLLSNYGDLNGNICVSINSSGVGIDFVTWNAVALPPKTPVTKQMQKNGAATISGQPVGCFPLT